LWEKLVLDGFQAGLSWITILRKRDTFRAAFPRIRPGRPIATWGEADVARCLPIPASFATAARSWPRSAMRVPSLPSKSAARSPPSSVGFRQVARPSRTPLPPLADVLRGRTTYVYSPCQRRSRREGFKFCGPTIVYAFMQACGLVNDHLVGCPRHAEVAAMG
jgi:DNA-3-methyladenine glycosylase I